MAKKGGNTKALEAARAARQANPGNPDETDSQKLARLTKARVPKLIAAIRRVGNLGRLKPTQAQTKATFGALEQAFTAAQAKWEGTKEAAASFEFPEA